MHTAREPAARPTPSMSLRTGDLHGRRIEQELVLENELRLGGGAVDRRGLRLGPADRLAGSAVRTVEWLADAAEVRGLEHWKRLKGPAADLTRAFLGRRSDAAAWVWFETCREPLASQSPLLRNHPWGEDWEQPLACGRPGTYPLRSADPAVPDVELDRAALLFAGREGGPARKVARFTRSRGAVGPGGFQAALFDGWCAADPVDDREDVGRGVVPASVALRDVRRVSHGRLLNWCALDAAGRVEAVTFELDPESGLVVSVRRARYPFELALLMHPAHDGWLARLVGSVPPDVPDAVGITPAVAARLQAVVAGGLGQVRGPYRGLRLLLGLARHGSLRQAGLAAGYGTTVKELRKAIGELEREVGAKLVETVEGVIGRRNQARLTPLGAAVAGWFGAFECGEPAPGTGGGHGRVNGSFTGRG